MGCGAEMIVWWGIIQKDEEQRDGEYFERVSLCYARQASRAPRARQANLLRMAMDNCSKKMWKSLVGRVYLSNAYTSRARILGTSTHPHTPRPHTHSRRDAWQRPVRQRCVA